MTESASTIAPQSNLTKDLTWLKQHVVLLVLLVSSCLGSVYLVEGVIAKHDATITQRFSQQVASDAVANKNLTDKLSQDEQNWKDIASQLLAQNAQLSTAKQQRDTATQQQVKVDSTLNVQQAASKLASETNATAGQVAAVNNSVVLDLPIAQNVIGQLDTLTSTKQDLIDTQTQLTNETKIVTDQTADIAEEKDVASGLETQLIDSNKACSAQIKAINSKHRKSMLKFGFVMYVAGFISGKLVKPF